MLDLNSIFSMREQMLPQEGFVGFLLNHWLKVAIALMILGFVIDQVLYVVRCRPQDKWKQRIRAIRNFKNKQENPVIHESMMTVTTERTTVQDVDAPVIRRGGAKYAPVAAKEPMEVYDEEPYAEQDDDAPMVVRAPARPVRARSAEPDTRRGND